MGTVVAYQIGRAGGLPQRVHNRISPYPHPVPRPVCRCPQNFERGTGAVILGSGHRALAADPPFSRVVLCELQPRTAAKLERTLREAHPECDLVVLAGDCNIEMPKYLQALSIDWRRSRLFSQWWINTALKFPGRR